MRKREFLFAKLDYKFIVFRAREIHINSTFSDFNGRSLAARFAQHKLGELDRTARSEPDRTSVLKLYLSAAILPGAKLRALGNWQIDHCLLKLLRRSARDLHAAVDITQAHRPNLRIRECWNRGKKETCNRDQHGAET